MRKSDKRAGLSKLFLAGLAVTAIASAPLVGSAAGMSNGIFGIKAVDTEDSSITATHGMSATGGGSEEGSDGGSDGGSTTPPVVTPTPDPEPTRAPDPTPDLISMTLLDSCTDINLGVVKRDPDTGTTGTPQAKGTIDWGDGTTSKIPLSGSDQHTYSSSASARQIKITGTVPGLGGGYSNIPDCVKSIDHMGENTGIVTLDQLFANSTTAMTVAAPPTSLKYARGMFGNARNFNGDLSDWVLPNLKDASAMFVNASSFTGKNGSLSNLNPKSLVNASSMFSGANVFNSDLSKWRTPALTNMSGMFNTAYAFTSDLSGWNVSNVTDFSNAFTWASEFDSDLSNWKVDRATTMKNMFNTAKKFKGTGLENWSVSNVTNMQSMFQAATIFNGNVSSWRPTSATSMEMMFYESRAFDHDLSSWKDSLGNVTTMRSMFYNARAYKSDLSSWKVPKVTNHTSFSTYSGMNPAQEPVWIS